MKKLIVVFVLLCSGVIYFSGSACSGECDGEKDGLEVTGPTVDRCATVPVPVSDFQPEPAQFYVGDTVKFTFTGSGMDEVPGSGRNCLFEYWFQGPGITHLWDMSENDRINYAKFSEEGTTTIKLICSNGCWNNTKVKTYTVTSRPLDKDGKPDNPKEINTIIEE